MPTNDATDITLEELKTIIHGLRMSTLAFVEDNAIDEIKSMIKALPLPEDIDRMALYPNSVKNLQRDIGNIMRIIELYGKRDIEFKTRYKSRTGLPPRYKVLDWKEKSAMSHTAIKSSLVRNLIKLSAQMDEEGRGVLSQGFIDCSKKIQNGELPIKELYFLTKEVASCSDGLRKEAQALTDINLDFSDITNGLQQVSGWFKSIQEGIQSKKEYLQKHPKTQAFVGQLDNIWKQVSQLSQATDAQIAQVQQSTQAISTGMESLVPQSMMVNGKPVPIQFEDDPNDPGYQKAVVSVGGQKFEVQEDENGKRSLKKVEATPATPAIGTTETATATPVTQPAQPATETAAQPIAEVQQQKTLPPNIMRDIGNLLKTPQDFAQALQYAKSIMAGQKYNLKREAQNQAIDQRITKYINEMKQQLGTELFKQFVTELEAKQKGTTTPATIPEVSQDKTPTTQPQAQPKFKPNQDVYYTSKEKPELNGTVKFLGYVKQINNITRKEEDWAQIQLQNGKKLTVSPKRVSAQAPVTSSSKFNLKTYKTASRK